VARVFGSGSIRPRRAESMDLREGGLSGEEGKITDQKGVLAMG